MDASSQAKLADYAKVDWLAVGDVAMYVGGDQGGAVRTSIPWHLNGFRLAAPLVLEGGGEFHV